MEDKREASGEEKKSVVNHFAPGSNCQVFNGNITGCTFVMPGATVTQQQPPQPCREEPDVDTTADVPQAGGLSHEVLAKALSAVQQYMWGASAYAVLFCECRDHHHYPNNMAQFERDADSIAQEKGLDWLCNPGTLSDAFRHNPYLLKHVDNWAENGAKKRTLLLLKRFQEVLPKKAPQ